MFSMTRRVLFLLATSKIMFGMTKRVVPLLVTSLSLLMLCVVSNQYNRILFLKKHQLLGMGTTAHPPSFVVPPSVLMSWSHHNHYQYALSMHHCHFMLVIVGRGWWWCLMMV